ncbi:conserved hypothetical protein [Carnobacterium maltaromaticum]|uniref:trypsin-like serine peptidase n=1 Tax=Carnobacterium maltaromaticum TaxID=2751 RepID=UPI00191BC583|nr:trypsin-like serine protease [Carnobacterium maltaromaticum]CAD5901012.1 conserved hypothetical protein [Carnobacterium maltaromaticum]
MKKKHIGKVIFFSGNKKYAGTGNIIYIDAKKIIIATAAHCVYDYEQCTFFSNISFYTDDIKEKVEVDKVFVNKSWVECGDLDADYAFMTILKKSVNVDFMNDLECTPPLFELGRGKTYSVHGIPNRFVIKEKIKTYMGHAIEDNYRHSNMQGVQAKAEVGVSGGPWLIDIDGTLYQNSNSSATFSEVEGILWGPYWGNECKAVYETSLNENMISNLVIEYKGGDLNE